MIDQLADPNIWLRSSKPNHVIHPAATQAVKTVLEAYDIYLVPTDHERVLARRYSPIG